MDRNFLIRKTNEKHEWRGPKFCLPADMFDTLFAHLFAGADIVRTKKELDMFA